MADQVWRVPETMDDIWKFIDLDDKNFWMSIFLPAWVVFHWNVICRYEYRTKFFSKTFGSPYWACVTLSFVQIFFSQLRNYYFMQALASQPVMVTPYSEILSIVSNVILAIGMVLVVSSFYALGWTGTWHGDHFGILLPAKVTSFPFNILDHPMYVGGILNFLASAIGACSLSGLLLTFWVQICYVLVEMVEGPFTEMIYAEAAKKKSKRSR